MAPQTCAFASPVALLRPRSAVATSSRSAPAIRMAAATNGDKKKQTIWEWLDSKVMPHQADYDETMSETFVPSHVLSPFCLCSNGAPTTDFFFFVRCRRYMRQIMDAREEKMEEMYKEQK